MKIKWRKQLWFNGMLFYEALRPSGTVYAEVYNIDRLIGWNYSNIMRTNWWIIKPVHSGFMLKKDRVHPTLKAAKKAVEDYATGTKKFEKNRKKRG